MAEKTHHGSCHCGAVKYRVDLDVDQPAIQCNCSICARSGSLLQFVPVDKFTLEQGEANLTDYKFNKNVINHQFCKTCGTKSFARGEGPKGPMVAINIRCLDGFELKDVKIHDYDGRAA